ncbi:MAG: hypothetical protein D3904_02190 [Candidatus Electrothrix sp. EH2]|nr:hypothetical protein [Candidatus Electrothrix sp. EH2]
MAGRLRKNKIFLVACNKIIVGNRDQMLGGLITYLLMAIYFRKNFNDKVFTQNIMLIRLNIQNELMAAGRNNSETCYCTTPSVQSYAKKRASIFLFFVTEVQE